MKEWLACIRREWEISLLAALALLVCLGGMLLLLLGGEVSLRSGAAGYGGWEPEPLVTEQGLAFTRDESAGATVEPLEPGLFGLPGFLRELLLPAPKPRPVVKPAPVVAPEPVVAPPPAAENVVQEEPAPMKPTPVAKQAPPPRQMRGSLYFADVQELANGTLVALMELARGEERLTLALGKGETSHGITILRVSEGALQVQDAKRQRYLLKRDKDVGLWVQEQ